MRTIVGCAALCASLIAGSASAADGPAAGSRTYAFLRGSAWYVPTSTLPAPVMDLTTGKVRMLSDQTVWQITNYRKGYFWGRTVAVLTDPSTGEPTGDPTCMRMIGSVTPSGEVQITFIQSDATTAAGAVRGTGILGEDKDGTWRFQMQMSSGLTSLVVHWSYMDQCKPGQACETKLPGSELGLSAFLAQCPAS